MIKISAYGFKGILHRHFKQTYHRLESRLRGMVSRLSSQPIVFFCSRADISLLNKAILYIKQNEQTRTQAKQLEKFVMILDQIYPHMRLDYISVKGSFGPEMVELVSKALKVPKNLML